MTCAELSKNSYTKIIVMDKGDFAKAAFKRDFVWISCIVGDPYFIIHPERLSSWWRNQMETFSALLAMCARKSPMTMNSPHKGQWRGALMFSLIGAWINGWVNNCEADDLRCHHAHYDVTLMIRHLFLAIETAVIIRHQACLRCIDSANSKRFLTLHDELMKREFFLHYWTSPYIGSVMRSFGISLLFCPE